MKKSFMLGLVVIFAAMFASTRAAVSISTGNSSSIRAKAADQFEIYRRVVFYNGITDEYILAVEGYSSISVDSTDNQLELTVKTGPDQFVKHFLGLSDNVTYFAEQIEPANVDDGRYRVIFKPSVIVPNVDLK